MTLPPWLLGVLVFLATTALTVALMVLLEAYLAHKARC